MKLQFSIIILICIFQTSIFAQSKSEIANDSSSLAKVITDNETNSDQQLYQKEGDTLDAYINQSMSIAEYFADINQIDNFIEQFDVKIRKELERVEQLVELWDYSTLTELVNDGYFNYFMEFNNSDKVSIKQGDVLYVRFRAINWNTNSNIEKLESYARKKLESTNIRDTNFILTLCFYNLKSEKVGEDRLDMFQNIYPDFPFIHENHLLIFEPEFWYAMQVDPRPEYKADKEKYAMHLLGLIESLLKDYVQDISFDEFMQKEEGMGQMSLDQKIKLRYSFLNYLYEKFN